MGPIEGGAAKSWCFPAQPWCRTAEAVRIFKTIWNDAVQVMPEKPLPPGARIRASAFRTLMRSRKAGH